MKELPILREEAISFLKEYSQSEFDMIHYLESGAIMKSLAKKLNEDENYYEMLGLLHDIDWSLTKQDTKKHLTFARGILEKKGFDQEFIEIVISHGYGFDCADLINKKRTKKIEFALAASETLSGLIHSYALMRGKKISDMQASGLNKKFKDKAFAAGCNRNIIREIENCSISLDEFFELAIEGIKSIKEEVGLN